LKRQTFRNPVSRKKRNGVALIVCFFVFFLKSGGFANVAFQYNSLAKKNVSHRTMHQSPPLSILLVHHQPEPFGKFWFPSNFVCGLNESSSQKFVLSGNGLGIDGEESCAVIARYTVEPDNVSLDS
jgi:hypothetical protein